MTRRVRIPLPEIPGVTAVPGWLDGAAASPWLLVLAPGAGAPADSGLMSTLAAQVASKGVRVLRFDFPYQVRARREGSRRPPDRAPVLLATWRAVLAYVRRRLRPAHLAIGGKSMGGRYATLLLAEVGNPAGGPSADPSRGPLGCQVEAAVLVGYPLHPPGKPDRMRAGHLGDLGVPSLFVSGTRDALARIDALREVVRSLPPAELYEVDAADHDFKVPKRSGRTRLEVTTEVASAIAAFLDAPESAASRS